MKDEILPIAPCGPLRLLRRIPTAWQSEKQAFWINEPIFSLSQQRQKWLIINSLQPRMNVIKKRQLQNEPIF
jgi:hypothetical protein